MGLAPAVWGPATWKTIHLLAAGAPEALSDAQRAQYRAFFAALGPVLPCAACAQHLPEVLAALPLDESVRGREELLLWSVRLHNRVSADLGKPTLPEAAAVAHWKAVAGGGSGGGLAAATSENKGWLALAGLGLALLAAAGIAGWAWRPTPTRKASR